MNQLKQEEISEWLDNPITQAFFEGLALRKTALRTNLADGGAYNAGNPFVSAELHAAYLSKIAELDYIINNPTEMLESEEEDESDGDTASGPPPADTA